MPIYKQVIKKENLTWTFIEIKHIIVKGGKIEIGFMAEGEANAFCHVDDVSVMKNK